MKYYIKPAALLIFGLGLLNSCSDNFFDTDTGGRITPDQFYNSMDDAERSHAGCYILLQDVAENMVLVDGLLSDQMDVTNNSNLDMMAINLHESTVDNQYASAANFYKIIINVNEVIPNLPQIIKKDRDFDSVTCKAFTGSLVTLRSWAYFQLVKWYGKARLLDTDMNNFDPEKEYPLVEKSAMIDLLINDLLVYVDEEDIYRYQIDLYALLGELYLEKNDYTNAEKYLKFSIDGPARLDAIYMVTKDYEKAKWGAIFLNSEEQYSTVMTAVPYSIQDGHQNQLEDWMYWRYMVKPSTTVMQAYENETPVDEYRGLGITYAKDINGTPFICKYILLQDYRSSADVILYRDADLHLLLAEALNRMGKTDAALLILNDGISSVGVSKRPEGYTKWGKNVGVRGRVGLDAKTVPDGVNVVEYVEDLIIQERAEELAFEGKRWFDLIRIANRRNNPAYLADKVAAKFSNATTASAIRAKLMNPDNWKLPVE